MPLFTLAAVSASLSSPYQNISGQFPNEDVEIEFQQGTPCRSATGCLRLENKNFGSACLPEDNNCYEVHNHTVTVPLSAANTENSFDFGNGTDLPWDVDFEVTEGDIYVGRVITQDDNFECKFSPSTATLLSGMPVFATCQKKPEITEMYSIGGSITGLDANMFVRLNMNGGNFVTIEGSECPAGCSWAFSDEFVKYTEYDVQVSKHPVSEDETENQRCYVTNGEGTLTPSE